MKKLAIVTSVVCCAIFLASCAPPATGPINPGDKIGNFLITTGDAKAIEDTWMVDCPDAETALNYHCNAKVGQKVNVSWGVYGNSLKPTDTIWAEHTHEIFINGRPVNLEAFSTQDVVHPHVGQMRYWNIVIVASAPGELTARNMTVVDGEAQDSTATFTFSAP
jgi:hypothetical protein